MILNFTLLAFEFEIAPSYLTGSSFNEDVTTSVIQEDGKILIGGLFTNVVGVPMKRIARLESNGNLDLTFNVGEGFNDDVKDIKILSNGKILVGGLFSEYNGVPTQGLALLNSDGSLDNTFEIGTGVNGDVFRIVLLKNTFMISGEFTDYRGASRLNVARIFYNGQIDNSFVPFQFFDTSSVPYYSLAVQTDGKVLIGGIFTIANNGTVVNIARLNANGSLDSTFSARTNGTVYSITISLNGQIMVGGGFNLVNNISKVGFTRLNSNGALDNTFVQGRAGFTREIKNQSDGKLLLSGDYDFSTNFIKLNSNGTIDKSFNTYGDDVISFSILSDNQYVIVGNFFHPISPSSAKVGAIKLDADGNVDTSFLTRNGAATNAISVFRTKIQQNGKILISGSFSLIGGIERPGLARLHRNGVLDESFVPAVSAGAIASQADGKVYVGGSTSNSSIEIKRLNIDGTLDSSFSVLAEHDDPSTGIRINDILVQPDGKIVAIGDFDTVNGIPQQSIVRFDQNGIVDTSFNPAQSFGDGEIRKVIRKPGGSFLVTGFIFHGSGRLFFVNQLNADGTIDTNFGFIQPNNGVLDLVLHDNGFISICGNFTSINSIPRNKLARFNPNGTFDMSLNPPIVDNDRNIWSLFPLSDNKLLIGGDFSRIDGVIRNKLALLNADGTADNDFQIRVTSGNNPNIFSFAKENNGSLIVSGIFTSLGTDNNFNNLIGRYGTARLTFGQSRTLFDFDGDGKTDISIFRPGPNPAQWWLLRSSDGGNNAYSFGLGSDKAVPADFTGDGKTDLAFFRESTSDWFILRSEDSSFYSFPFGASGDIPSPGDFDGDGIADAAVYRPSSGTWFINRSSDGGTTIESFGIAEDKPTVADFDGDGKDDIAIYRPSVSQWWQLRSTDGVIAYQFGTTGDKTVQGDYTGDGKADVALFRPSSNEWFILRSENGTFYSFPYGASGDIPTPGDYDGDGTFDAAVFRPSTTTWFLNGSTSGTQIVGFGLSTDIPLASVFNVE